MKVWQCTKTTYHTMVRPVTRCTLCGSRVEEKELKVDIDNTDSEKKARLELEMMFEPF